MFIFYLQFDFIFFFPLNCIFYYYYFYRHYPKTSFTIVTDTPENLRLKQQSMLNSQVGDSSCHSVSVFTPAHCVCLCYLTEIHRLCLQVSVCAPLALSL